MLVPGQGARGRFWGLENAEAVLTCTLLVQVHVKLQRDGLPYLPSARGVGANSL